MSVDLENLDIDKPIVLVGMMGCGKSLIAEKLVSAMGVALYDIDAMIKDDEDRTINEIFADEGEAYFRTLEADKIDAVLAEGLCVISTGGGALKTPRTLENIKEKAVFVWLDVDIDTIYKRIKDDKNRPLLQGDNPKAKLEELLAAREHLYKQADIRVDNSGDPNDTVAEIGDKLSFFLTPKVDIEGCHP